MYISKENRKKYGEIASLYEIFYDTYNRADFSTRNLAKAAAIYQREIFPLLTILLTVAVTFIGVILTYYGSYMAQQKIAAALLVFFDCYWFAYVYRSEAKTCVGTFDYIRRY
ncbi:hypothetical protein [Megasphaera stantonii]|uniref:hypothetical protein n=1 Tax=Megasphaera stantonii TaxID=2144175 RepID=UPI00320A17FA